MNEPIISGFYPDPTICRVGDDYFTAHSSFEYVPGVPIFTSTDLTTWTQIGNAITRPAQLAPNSSAANSGIYAATLRHHDGRFWLITTNVVESRRGQLIVSARDPAGPWSDATLVPDAIGLDPDLSWDEDGVCRITWVNLDPTCPGICTAPLNLATGEFLAPPQQLWQGSGYRNPEGPHLYRIAGWWYLLIAEGGTERGHTVAIARARELEGDWEPAPSNPILTHRSTDHPIQNVGHADIVQTADGWAMVYHGVRARGLSPMWHVNGRETFLAGIDWVDGWPQIDENRYDIEGRDNDFVDRFDGPLHPRWIAPGGSPDNFVEPGMNGLSMRALDVPVGAAGIIGVRPRDLEWEFQVTLSGSGTGRVLVRIDPDRWYGITVSEHRIEATLAIGPLLGTVGSVERTTDEVQLRIAARNSTRRGVYGIPEEPDMIELAVDSGGEATTMFGSFDGRYLSTEVAGGFTGRVAGIEVLEGQITLKEASYRTLHDEPPAPPPGSRYDVNTTTLSTLLADPDTRRIIDELLPRLAGHPFLPYMEAMTIDVLDRAEDDFPAALVQELRARLAGVSPRKQESRN